MRHTKPKQCTKKPNNNSSLNPLGPTIQPQLEQRVRPTTGGPEAVTTGDRHRSRPAVLSDTFLSYRV